MGLFGGMVALGLAGLLLIGVVMLAIVALSIWAIVDACQHPDDAWSRIGQSRPLWLALLIGAWLLTGFLGPVLALVYLATVRPRLLAAERYPSRPRPLPRPPPPPPYLRVSDTDRDLAGGWLRHHYTVGRLTYDELLQRLDEAYAARTVSDLERALRELPRQ